MTILRNAALVLALAGAAATAHAGVKLSAVRTNTFFHTDNAGTFLPLNEAGATTLSFNLSSSGKKVLTYSLFCATASVYGLDLDIIVNGVAVAPTARYEPFCESDETLATWVRPSITIAIQGIKGNNTVRILARGTTWLGESSLVVHD
jgi:hypothetical protein